MAANAFSPSTWLHSALATGCHTECAGLEQVLARVMIRAVQDVANLAFGGGYWRPAQHFASPSGNRNILATIDSRTSHLVCSDTAHYSHQLCCMLGAHKLTTLQLFRDVRPNHVVTAMQMVDEGASMGSIWWIALQCEHHAFGWVADGLRRCVSAQRHCTNKQRMLSGRASFRWLILLHQRSLAAPQWVAPASSLAGSHACGQNSSRQALRACAVQYAHLHQPEVVSSHRPTAQPGPDAEHIIAASRRAGH